MGQDGTLWDRIGQGQTGGQEIHIAVITTLSKSMYDNKLKSDVRRSHIISYFQKLRDKRSNQGAMKR